LKALSAEWSSLAEFDAVSTEAALRQVAEACGVKAGTLIHAVRVAVTGTAVSPGLFEVVALVGRARVLERLASAVRLVAAPSAG
jgi:glutamyl-tRNA synthetase